MGLRGASRATNKVIAVKVLSRSDDALDWGPREAVLCSRIRHPNVLRVLRTQPTGAFWIVLMELVVGDPQPFAQLNLRVPRLLSSKRTKEKYVCGVRSDRCPSLRPSSF